MGIFDRTAHLLHQPFASLQAASLVFGGPPRRGRGRRRHGRVAMAICIGSVAGTSLGFVAAQASTDAIVRFIQRTPNPTTPNGSFNTVSCISTTSCEAVGSNVNKQGATVTLAAVWNGTDWARQATPEPSGTIDGQLSSVSCVSATSCEAVGLYVKGSGPALTLAELWNGASWTIQTTPNPSRAISSSLDSVSCVSGTSCEAVGIYLKHVKGSLVQVTLAEMWNGTAWARQVTPNPTGATDSSLDGVSCVSTTSCEAVGDSYTKSSNVTVTLAEVWNGTAWGVQVTPSPSGAIYSSISGVSCVSAGSCEAVGYSTDSSGVAVTLAEVWNGAAWGVQVTPNPPGADTSLLSGVSCVRPTSCEAVGLHAKGSGVAVTLAEVWNGTAWSIQTTPKPTGATASGLSSVSCVSRTNCTAVGSYFNSSGLSVSLGEVWNGTSWGVQATPNPAGADTSSLHSVSCVSAGSCEAAGSYTDSSGVEVTLGEVWNGTAWGLQATPNPPGADTSNLHSVSCVSAASCEAVGSYTDSSGVEVTLGEVWNGTAWSVQTTSDVAGATASGLSSVSCVSAGSCEAVGSYTDSSGVEVTLGEVWNGTSWSIQTTPNAAGADTSSLHSVSCVSAGSCEAVGSYTDSSGVEVTLGEVWNGTSWATKVTPNPPGATASGLSSVSCVGAGSCEAVGSYTNIPGVSGAGVTVTLAMANN